MYVNKKKISGVNDVDKSSTEKIYKQYLRIFKKGAYNYIREDVDPMTNQAVPRKYFSGGCFMGDSAMWTQTLQVPDPSVLPRILKGYTGSNFAMANVELSAIGQDPLVDLQADSAQLSKSILSKFFIIVALAAAAGSAHAAIITPNADGKTLHVQVNNPKDTFSGILHDAHYERLYGPNGAVAKVGEVVKGQIPNVKLIYLDAAMIFPTPAATAEARLAAKGATAEAAPQQAAPVSQAGTEIKAPAPAPHRAFDVNVLRPNG